MPGVEVDDVRRDQSTLVVMLVLGLRWRPLGMAFIANGTGLAERDAIVAKVKA